MNNVTRWNPFREIAEMQRQLDRAFDDAWSQNDRRLAANQMPLDVAETESDYRVIANLPGLTVDDINVNFHDGVLTISGDVQDTRNEDGNNILVRERAFGKFSRRISLPMPVDVDAIGASYDNGVLTLTLPKADSVKPRQIEVKSHNLLDTNN